MRALTTYPECSLGNAKLNIQRCCGHNSSYCAMATAPAQIGQHSQRPLTYPRQIGTDSNQRGTTRQPPETDRWTLKLSVQSLGPMDTVAQKADHESTILIERPLPCTSYMPAASWQLKKDVADEALWVSASRKPSLLAAAAPKNRILNSMMPLELPAWCANQAADLSSNICFRHMVRYACSRPFMKAGASQSFEASMRCRREALKLTSPGIDPAALTAMSKYCCSEDATHSESSPTALSRETPTLCA